MVGYIWVQRAFFVSGADLGARNLDLPSIQKLKNNVLMAPFLEDLKIAFFQPVLLNSILETFEHFKVQRAIIVKGLLDILYEIVSLVLL